MFSSIGTILSGVVSAAGCGRMRVEGREGRLGTTLCVNFAVGVMQLFTVPFMLVGWIWSLVWGIYFIILAGIYYILYSSVVRSLL